jgi:CHAT domain-containing protein
MMAAPSQSQALWRQQLDAGANARGDGSIYESLSLLEDAVAHAPDPAARVRAMTQLGLTLEQAGRLADADALLQSAYHQASGAARISIALALGNVAAAQRDVARASRYYDEVLAADEQTAAQAPRIAAELNLARLQDAAERAARLERLYPRLASIPAVSERARAYLSLGALAGGSLAERSLGVAADLAQQGGDAALRVECADALAELYERQGRVAEALEINRTALSLAGTLPLGQSEALLVKLDWRDGRLNHLRGDDARALADELEAARHVEAIRQDLPIEDESGQSTYQALLRPLFVDLVDLELKNVDTLEVGERTARLTSVLEAVELTHQAEMQDYLGERCAVESIRGNSSGIPDAGVAVVYTVILEDRVEVIVRTHDGILHHSVPIGAAALERDVAEFRRQLADYRSRAFLATGQRLYAELLEPFESELTAAKVSELVVVPDRYLRLIPFAALHDGRQYLAERYVISSVTGLTMTAGGGARTMRIRSLLAGLSEPGPVVGRLIAMGYGVANDTDARATAMIPVTPEQRALRPVEEMSAQESALRSELMLPAVETEIQQLEPFGRSVQLLNGNFTVARFRREVTTGRYSVIHIATHGFLGDNAQQSFLLAFDDVIHVDDLQSLIADSAGESEGVELLTLSACNTAEGDDRAPLGFAGAAIKARARSVVGTLWSVNDAAAGEFMQAFYAGLRAHSKAQALTQAQRTLIRSRQFSHPYYWAPIVLIGDWT